MKLNRIEMREDLSRRYITLFWRDASIPYIAEIRPTTFSGIDVDLTFGVGASSYYYTYERTTNSIPVLSESEWCAAAWMYLKEKTAMTESHIWQALLDGAESGRTGSA